MLFKSLLYAGVVYHSAIWGSRLRDSTLRCEDEMSSG